MRGPQLAPLLLLLGCGTLAAAPSAAPVEAPSAPVEAPSAPVEAPSAPVEAPSAQDKPLGEGLASYYSRKLHGRRTASGEPLDVKALTAAHRTLPFGSCLRVVNLGNGREVRVRVNDRGPFKKERVVDVSPAAAQALDMVDQGLARVRLYRCEPVE